MTMVVVGIVGGVGSIANGIIGGSRAKQAMRKAAKEKRRLSAKLDSLENSRQEIVNPFANAEDLSGMINDLSGQMTNPFNSLGVATQAAEMQAEQADMALANSLDTIRATGSGAGGATALAQAALQSKKGVSASIETQEAANQKLRATGEQNLEARRTAEQQRVQQSQSSLRGQYQTQQGQGEQFAMEMTARQEQSTIDRTAAQMAGQVQAESQARAAETAAMTGAVSGAVGAFSGAMTAGFKANNKGNFDTWEGQGGRDYEGGS